MKTTADHFTLRIDLGNDAMRTWGDIASALRGVADIMDRDAQKVPEDVESEAIRDINGNRVGGWHTE